MGCFAIIPRYGDGKKVFSQMPSFVQSSENALISLFLIHTINSNEIELLETLLHQGEIFTR